ncbi:MAG TPA: FKBP-type peptidyl-prolyl cis-trans isomerase [Candidatus Angelobacter sp.]|nr:FKBP-type peptidyl-prolyl cis-trans isomerase [Candidatus Angelobacter sp.]
MRKIAAVMLILMATAAILAAQGQPASKAPVPNAPAPKTPAAQPDNSVFKNQKDKVSYAIGLDVGGTLRKQSIEVDPDVFIKGLKDALAGSKPQMSDEEIRATMTQLQTDMRARQEAKLKQAGEANKKEGDAFLAANKTKEGVVTLPNGLQYKILTPGTGPKPTLSDTVVCNYKGTFINGTEFDSSYKRNEPATFSLGGVIKGWTEALQLMPVGSKWELFIPPDLAYGATGKGPIGPETTLIFEVELVSIEQKKATPDK